MKGKLIKYPGNSYDEFLRENSHLSLNSYEYSVSVSYFSV